MSRLGQGKFNTFRRVTGDPETVVVCLNILSNLSRRKVGFTYVYDLIGSDSEC